MALSKEEILQAIEEMKVIELHELVEAIKEKYRFYSYGDCMFIN